MADFKEKFYTFILRFVYIAFCLLMKPQAMLQLTSLMGWHVPYFIVTFPLSLWILSIHCSFMCMEMVDMTVKQAKVQYERLSMSFILVNVLMER